MCSSFELSLAQHQVVWGRFGCQGFEPLGQAFQLVTQPNGTDPSSSNEAAWLLQLMGNPQLSISRLLSRQVHPSWCNRRLDSVLDTGLLTADFLQGYRSTRLGQWLEALEPVERVSPDFASLRHAAQHLCQLQHAQFVLDHLFFVTHDDIPAAS